MNDATMNIHGQVFVCICVFISLVIVFGNIFSPEQFISFLLLFFFPFCQRLILVNSGCRNKMPQTRLLKRQKFYFWQFCWSAGKLKIPVLASLVSSERSLLPCGWLPSHCVFLDFFLCVLVRGGSCSVSLPTALVPHPYDLT